MQWIDVDDIAVVRHMAEGRPEALACLYDRYSHLMTTVALRMLKERAAAEDLVHDVFLEAWRGAGGYRPERASVRTWLLVRLRSRALDRIRSSNVRRDARESIAAQRIPEESEAEAAAAGAEVDAVRRALDALPEAQRTVLELAYFSGLSSTEIATRMGSPVGTVKSRTAAALSRLKVTMGATGGEA